MATVRRNQATLTSTEWTALIDAINNMHGVGAAARAYRDFVALHVSRPPSVPLKVPGP